MDNDSSLTEKDKKADSTKAAASDVRDEKARWIHRDLKNTGGNYHVGDNNKGTASSDVLDEKHRWTNRPSAVNTTHDNDDDDATNTAPRPNLENIPVMGVKTTLANRGAIRNTDALPDDGGNHEKRLPVPTAQQEGDRKPGAIRVDGPRIPSSASSSSFSSSSINDANDTEKSARLLIEATLVEGGSHQVSERMLEQIEREARTKILQQAVEAQVVDVQDDDPDDENQQTTRKMPKVVVRGCILILVIVGIIVGVILATRDGGQASSALQSDATAVPTLSPRETVSPTVVQSSSVPPYSPLDNFFCDQAIPLILGGPPITGLIQGNATLDPYILYCRGNEQSAYVDIGRGVWYRYEGQGKPVQVEVQGDASLNVYEMPDGGAQNCGTGLAECPDDAYSGRSITWNAFTGIVYHILVSNQNLEGEDTFEISLSDNDSCQNALGPISVATPRTFFGTILAESPQIDEMVLSCGSSSVLETAGAWYQVTGTGRRITASTCGGTGFDTQISVFEGNCNNLECIDGNDDACGSQSLVAWDSASGTTYFVLVHSTGRTFGNFGLQLESEGADFVPESFCGTAPRLVLGSPRTFNILDAAVPEANVELCDAPSDPMYHPEVAGLWFRISGTGNRLLVEITDTSGGVFDTACGTSIIVTTGPRCAELSCVVFACYEQCEFPSIATEDYYIFVNDAYGSANEINGMIRVSEALNF